jgi:hypothetical protein
MIEMSIPECPDSIRHRSLKTTSSGKASSATAENNGYKTLSQEDYLLTPTPSCLRLQKARNLKPCSGRLVSYPPTPRDWATDYLLTPSPLRGLMEATESRPLLLGTSHIHPRPQGEGFWFLG